MPAGVELMVGMRGAEPVGIIDQYNERNPECDLMPFIWECCSSSLIISCFWSNAGVLWWEVTDTFKGSVFHKRSFRSVPVWF